MTDAAAAGPALSLRGLRKTVGGADRRFALEADALDLVAGKVTLLTGPSGSGKSTLLEIAGLASRPDAVRRFEIATEAGPVDAGALLARGDRTALAALRAGSLGFVLQTGGLVPFLTVAENLALAQTLAGRPDAARAAALLEALGLEGLDRATPAGLSVGQRQRAAVARALAHRPAVLLADEPTAALDPASKAQTASLLVDAALRFGAAVLVATHEPAAFADAAARRYRLAVTTGPQGATARLEAACAA